MYKRQNPENQPARLSLTFALLDKGDYEAARTEITQLLAKYPQRIDYIIASADIDIADNKPAQALKTLQEALLLNPDNVSLGLYAARAATLNQQGKLSLMWLEPLSHTRPEDPIVWQALIEAINCKIRQLSLSPLLAETVRRINNEESISAMFDLF